jgi:hypothetical protein
MYDQAVGDYYRHTFTKIMVQIEIKIQMNENAMNSSTLVVSSQVETVTCSIAQDTKISVRQTDHKFVLTFLVICGIYIYSFSPSSVNRQRTFL